MATLHHNGLALQKPVSSEIDLDNLSRNRPTSDEFFDTYIMSIMNRVKRGIIKLEKMIDIYLLINDKYHESTSTIKRVIQQRVPLKTRKELLREGYQQRNKIYVSVIEKDEKGPCATITFQGYRYAFAIKERPCRRLSLNDIVIENIVCDDRPSVSGLFGDLCNDHRLPPFIYKFNDFQVEGKALESDERTDDTYKYGSYIMDSTDGPGSSARHGIWCEHEVSVSMERRSPSYDIITLTKYNNGVRSIKELYFVDKHKTLFVSKTIYDENGDYLQFNIIEDAYNHFTKVLSEPRREIVYNFNNRKLLPLVKVFIDGKIKEIYHVTDYKKNGAFFRYEEKMNGSDKLYYYDDFIAGETIRYLSNQSSEYHL